MHQRVLCYSGYRFVNIADRDTLMKRTLKTFGYIAFMIGLAGMALGALYGALVGGVTLMLTGGLGGLLGGAWFGAIFGGFFGSLAGAGMGVVVGLAVAIAQASYTQPYTLAQARFIGRVGDVTILVVCIGAVIFSAGAGGELLFIGIPAIIAFLACHKIVFAYLSMSTRDDKQKVKSSA